MLSKKKKKLAEFINNTRHIDYKNTTDIIESFNSSIAYFSRFKELLDGGDEEAASRKLRDAGNKLYNSCEWSYKNYLYNKYKELYANGSIKYSECCILCAKLNARDCDLGHLISELNRVANPNPSSAGVDLSQIRGNAYFVNNGPKHSAMIPDPEKYLLSATEIRKFIKHYIDNEALLASSNDSIYGNENAWYEFKQDCDEFDETNSYVLIIGPLTGIRKEDAKKLFAIRWDMVFDFDASSDIDGLAALYRNITGINPVIRDLSRENVRKRINPSSTPYWVMASGYADDLSSISTSKDWRLKYGRNLADFLDKFHAEYTKPAKVIIASFNEDRIIEKIIQDYNVAYNNGEDIDFIALSSESDFARIDEDNFKISSLSLDALLSNLNNITMSNYTSSNSDTIIIPGRDCDKSLEKDFYARLRDSFEVVYKGIELKEVDDPSKNNPEEFYKGATHISWYGLKRHFDIERKDYKHIEKRIKDELDDKGRVIRSLHYEPGVGGTTTMRRLAWELHNENPVLILKEHLGEQTVKSVEKLYNISKLPILILADSNDISAIDARKLHGELKIENFPFLIYYVERKNKYTKPSDIESNGLLINLSEDEAKEMKNVLEPFTFDFSRDEQLERICKNNSEERIPFIMSMYAFDKNFKGVKPYITNFLKYLLPESKKILSYIALADYANENIDTQFFADLFENNEIDSFIFEQDGAFNSLVVLTQKTGNKKYFRIKYPPFAEEILIQLSSGYDGTRIIFSNLLDYILSFIEDSRKNEYSYNHETVELLRTLFITRIEDADSTKPAFSPLIEQLRSECYTYSSSLDDSNDIIARIFKKLVEVYPDEPHFIAHLARYFFYIDKNYEMGIDKINEAITIAETIYSDREDPLLYHMKAMGYSSRITNKYINSIKKHFRNNEEDEMNEEIELLRDDANQAMELFKKVREMGNGIAGYISDVNLCIQIVDMGKYITGSYESAEFLSKNFDSWYMKYVDHACTIFEECKKRATDKDSLLIAETNGNLLQMIDELEDTISIWESYLSNSSAKQKPQIRRMLARAYQKKNNNRVPQKRNQQEIKRIVELMQQNIFEEHNKPENIRIWFDAIRQLKTDKTENVIDDAIVKLNSWVLSTGSIEAYYYRCILKFIKAVEGSTAAEGELPKLFRELKSKSEHMQNRTSIHEWFGREGEGLEKLISASEYRSNRKEEDIKDELHLLTGRISDNYVNDNHAYISLFGIDVFFNPFATGGRIDRSMTKQRVKFGLGFSYDGPRAFNSSIIPATPDDDVNKSDLLGVLEYGRIVKCEVIKNVEYFTKVRIIGFECAGSIHFDNLCNGYAKDNRPPVGRIIEAMVLNKGYDSKTNKETWYLTMNIKEGSDNNYSLTPFQKKLQEILENDK